MKDFTQNYRIEASLAKVWQALVDPEIIKLWSGFTAKMSVEEGATFELWDKDIHGKNLQVVPMKKLVQDWYGGDWS